MLPTPLLAIVSSTLCVAVAAGGGCGQKGLISCEVEIPPCLQSCITAYRLCTVCTTNLANIQSCIANVCPPAGQGAFASTYFRSLCATDTYMSERALISISGSCNPVIDAASFVDPEQKIMRAERRAKRKSREALRQA